MAFMCIMILNFRFLALLNILLCLSQVSPKWMVSTIWGRLEKSNGRKGVDKGEGRTIKHNNKQIMSGVPHHCHH